MDFEQVAESFNALKKEERIEAMIMAVEKDAKTKDIADETGMAASTVRKYLRDLRDAGVVEKQDDVYSYTDLGRNIRASIGLSGYEQSLNWLKKREDMMDEFRDEVKLQKKRVLKRKIMGLL